MAATTKTTVAAEEAAWESIVIGSGIGGMSVASLLSQCQEKHRVLVLEQHPYHAGGCCQSFERNGYRFGVGIHFVGNMKEDEEGGNGPKVLLDNLTPEGDRIEWTEMKDPGIVMIGKDKLKTYRIDFKRAEENLIEMFPSEKEDIKKYYALARKAAASFFRVVAFKALPRWMVSVLLNTGLDRLFDMGYHKYARMTVGEVVRSAVKDPDLRCLLEGGTTAYGMAPNDAPFVMHALLAGDGFGLFYPKGGPGQIPEKISRCITARGGEVRLNARVKKILVKDGRAVGVELSDGSTIQAKNVISDVGLVNTLRLIPTQHQPSHMRQAIAAASKAPLANGMTGMVLFVGLRGSYDDDFSLPIEVSAFPDNQIETCFTRLPDTLESLQAMKTEDLGVYVTCPSAKDGSWKETYPGKTTIEILVFGIPWKPFEDLIDESGRVKEENKEKYEQFKKTFGELIWARSRQALLEAGGSDKLPKFLADADFFDVGTPLTYHHFLASDRGAWYGLEHSTHRFDPRHYYLTLRPETGIDGLYLTGQDIMTDGMVGALFGGYFCAAKVLGEKNPMALTKKILVNRVKANVH